MRLDNIMDTDVATVPVNCTLKHLFDTFVDERLRHLVVVDPENNVVGMVTRKDLAGVCGGYVADSSSSSGSFIRRWTARPKVEAKNWFFTGTGEYDWAKRNPEDKDDLRIITEDTPMEGIVLGQRFAYVDRD